MFKAPFDVVLGSTVAKELNYKLNDTIYLSHGIAKGSLPLHRNHSFKVVGILNPTGTPVDKTVHVPLEGMSALHINNLTSDSKLDSFDLTPNSVTSCLIGLKSKLSLFHVQQRIIKWEHEPLMAIIPGVTLSRLWSNIRTIDTSFFLITILVTLITFIGLLLALFMSLNQRKRELAILRTMGARPMHLAYILILESLLITISGVMLGLLLMIGSGYVLTPFLEEAMGLILSLYSLSLTELYLALGIIVFGAITSFIPAWQAYRTGLSEGFISI